MSYRIEQKKRVVHIQAPAGDARFGFGSHLSLFLSSGSDNNVSPRTFDWSLYCMALNTFPLDVWAGEIQLPSRMWELACAADNGSIKANNKTVSGIEYIKSWKRAAAQPLELSLTDSLVFMPWLPTFFGFGLPQDGVLVFNEHAYQKEEMQAAFSRLEWHKGSVGQECRITTAEQLLDALFLYMRRSDLRGVNFNLESEAGCPFLEARPEQRKLAA